MPVICSDQLKRLLGVLTGRLCLDVDDGVSQGSFLTPTLFNLYTQPDTYIYTNADDITIASQHPKQETASTHLQYIHQLVD